MTNSKIKFRKEREFGDYFNDTFGFIIQEIKPLSRELLYFAVPFLLILAIVSTLFAVKFQTAMNSISDGKVDPQDFVENIGEMYSFAFSTFWPFLLITIIFGLISSTMLYSTVYSHIKLYNEQPDGFTIEQVWNEIRKHFLKVLATFVVTGILGTIGFILCVLPGIYLSVALCIIFCVMFFENKSIGASFNRSIKLINTNWWLTFGMLLIALIIFYIFSILISLPGIFAGLPSFLDNIQNPGKFNFSTTYYIFTSISNLLSQLILVIPLVLTGFIYYSFVEKIEKPGLVEKIDEINKSI